MIRHKSAQQLSIEEFRVLFQVNLDKGNQWIKFDNASPYGRCQKIFLETRTEFYAQ